MQRRHPDDQHAHEKKCSTPLITRDMWKKATKKKKKSVILPHIGQKDHHQKVYK